MSSAATQSSDLRLARCLGCGYSLRGLVCARCPECGRSFDANDPWTLRLRDRPGWLLRWLMRRPSFVGRALPTIAVAALAWGTSTPGWSDFAARAGIIILAACLS